MSLIVNVTEVAEVEHGGITNVTLDTTGGRRGPQGGPGPVGPTGPPIDVHWADTQPTDTDGNIGDLWVVGNPVTAPLDTGWRSFPTQTVDIDLFGQTGISMTITPLQRRIGAFVATSALLTIDRAITGTGTSGTPLTIPLGWMKPANSITCTVVGAFTPTSMTTGLALFWIPVGSVAGVGQLSAYINTSAASLTAHVDYRASTVLSLAHDPTFPADLPGQPWTP